MDLTIHVLITSVKPLRVYINDSYVMRLAGTPYEPFKINKSDANIVYDVNLNRFMEKESLKPFIKEQVSNRDILGGYIFSNRASQHHKTIIYRIKMNLSMICSCLRGLSELYRGARPQST